jgi:hypothetical protein
MGRKAVAVAERVDPEGAKIPEGKWRRRKRPEEFEGNAGNGLWTLKPREMGQTNLR